MTKVIVNKSIRVPAEKAWNALSSFRGIENYSPIEKSETTGEGAGALRTCYLPDGAAIHEVMNFAEDATMQMQYAITDGPFPITNYVSDIQVSSKNEDSCEIAWACQFNSSEEVKEDMVKLFEGFYNVIIEGLETHLSN